MVKEEINKARSDPNPWVRDPQIPSPSPTHTVYLTPCVTLYQDDLSCCAFDNFDRSDAS